MIDSEERVYGLLGLTTKSGNIVFGTEACIEKIEKRIAKLVIVASDASEKTKKNIKYICDKNNIPIKVFGTIDKISKCIGKNNKAVIGIKNESLANQISKIISGGDVIG